MISIPQSTTLDFAQQSAASQVNAPEPPPTRLSLSFASALLPPLAALRFDATCACRAVSKETYYRGKRDLLNLPQLAALRFDTTAVTSRQH